LCMGETCDREGGCMPNVAYFRRHCPGFEAFRKLHAEFP
jgi:hypothetical protein